MILLVIILSFVLLLSFVLNGFALYYLYRFSRIIMTFEDDIADVTSSLDGVESSMKKVSDIEMFYEDDSIKNVVGEVLDDVRIAKFHINLMIKRFTDRSKQRYVTVDPTEEEVQLALEAEAADDLEEGTVAHVGRPR